MSIKINALGNQKWTEMPTYEDRYKAAMLQTNPVYDSARQSIESLSKTASNIGNYLEKVEDQKREKEDQEKQDAKILMQLNAYRKANGLSEISKEDWESGNYNPYEYNQ